MNAGQPMHGAPVAIAAAQREGNIAPGAQMREKPVALRQVAQRPLLGRQTAKRFNNGRQKPGNGAQQHRLASPLAPSSTVNPCTSRRTSRWMGSVMRQWIFISAFSGARPAPAKAAAAEPPQKTPTAADRPPTAQCFAD